jgi:hypothetical protein
VRLRAVRARRHKHGTVARAPAERREAGRAPIARVLRPIALGLVVPIARGRHPIAHALAAPIARVRHPIAHGLVVPIARVRRLIARVMAAPIVRARVVRPRRAQAPDDLARADTIVRVRVERLVRARAGSPARDLPTIVLAPARPRRSARADRRVPSIARAPSTTTRVPRGVARHPAAVRVRNSATNPGAGKMPDAGPTLRAVARVSRIAAFRRCPTTRVKRRSASCTRRTRGAPSPTGCSTVPTPAAVPTVAIRR